MLSGSSLRALPQAIRHAHNVGCASATYTHSRLCGLQTRRNYTRILKTIVSKHISSISETFGPVLPSIPSPLSAPGPVATPRRTEEYSSSTAEPAVALEDDAAAETPEAPSVETNVQDHVRHLMRRVPHPVAIITSTDTKAPAETAFRGMTVSSFNTVTLYPEPIVSFNVKVPSETYNAIVLSSRFLVHLLAPNATTARLAREFSKGQENISLDDGNKFFQFASPRSSEILNPSIRTGEPPRLVIRQDRATAAAEEAVNFPFIFECKFLPQSCRVGDHVVVLGTVVNVFQDGREALEHDGAHSSEEMCLTYADMRFWKMGGTIPGKS